VVSGGAGYPLFSSLLLRGSPPLPPYIPLTPPSKASVQPRHPARYISLLRYNEAAAPLPRGEVAREDRIYRLGQARRGRGRTRTGTGVPSSLVHNRFLPADLGPTGWLPVANVIWGRLDGNPPQIKNRF
jgi:hypothetical protein